MRVFRTGATWVCAIAAIMLLPSPVRAQSEAAGAVSAGFAGASPASVSGPDAIFTNPARIAVSPGNIIAIGGASAFVGGPLLQFRHYNDAFTSGGVIDPDRARQIVRDWFGDPVLRTQRSAGVVATARPVAVTTSIRSRPVGFAVRTRAYGTVSINGGWVDLLLVGMEESRQVPLNGSTGFAMTTDVAASTAGFVRSDITAGMTLRVVVGHEYAEARMSSVSDIRDRALTHTFDYVVRSAGSANRDLVSRINLFDRGAAGSATFNPSGAIAGLGLGLDVGFDYAYSTRTNLAVSLTDLGAVRWTRDAVVEEPVNDTFYFEGIDFDLEQLEMQFENDIGAYIESKLDSLAREAYGETRRYEGSFSRALPAAAHVGLRRAYGRRASLVAGVSIPLNRAIGQASYGPRVHAGIEWRPGRGTRFPLRAGAQIGASGAVVLGFGFGVESRRIAFNLGAAVTPRSDVLGAGARYAAAISALEVRF